MHNALSATICALLHQVVQLSNLLCSHAKLVIKCMHVSSTPLLSLVPVGLFATMIGVQRDIYARKTPREMLRRAYVAS